MTRKRTDEPLLLLPDPELPRLAELESPTDEQIGELVRYGNADLPDSLMPKMIQAVRDQLVRGELPYPEETGPEGPGTIVRVGDRMVGIGKQYHPELWAWFDEEGRRDAKNERLWHMFQRTISAIQDSKEFQPSLEAIFWMLEGWATDQHLAAAMECDTFGDTRGTNNAKRIWEWVAQARASVAAGDAEATGVAVFAAMHLLREGGFLDKREHLRVTRRFAASRGRRNKKGAYQRRDAAIRRAAAGIRNKHPDWNTAQVIAEIRRSQSGPQLSARRLREILSAPDNADRRKCDLA